MRGMERGERGEGERGEGGEGDGERGEALTSTTMTYLWARSNSLSIIGTCSCLKGEDSREGVRMEWKRGKQGGKEGGRKRGGEV